MITKSLNKLNEKVAHSPIGYYFQLEGSSHPRPRSTTFTREVIAGLTTFITMTYIIAVNSLIVMDSGGTCQCQPPIGATGKELLCVGDPIYEQCLQTLRKDIITATCIVSGLSSILMGIGANLPIGLSSGMGLNAYFVYNVIGFHGVGGSGISYRTALAAVFIEGMIFVLLTILGIRQWIVKLMPKSLKHATCAGIGLFLCFIGLQNSAGIGLIASNNSTLVTLGGCPLELRDPVTQACKGGVMTGPTMWLGLLGLLLMVSLSLFRIKGAMLFAIILIAGISWFRNTPVTYFPNNTQGDAMFEFFSKVVGFHPIENTLLAFDFNLEHGNIWLALLTFLYVDILEATGNIFALANLAGMVDSKGDFEGATFAFICDAISISIGAIFGVPPVTAFLESGVGIAEGGKTGITAIVIGILFLISTFLAPVFASFPPWSTGPALILVGALMCQNLIKIRWNYLGEAVPAFLTLAMMPFTYSIAYGLISGLFAYAAFNGTVWLIEKMTFGRLKAIKPDDEELDDASISTFELSSLAPPWVPAFKKKFNQFKGVLAEQGESDTIKQVDKTFKEK